MEQDTVQASWSDGVERLSSVHDLDRQLGAPMSPGSFRVKRDMKGDILGGSGGVPQVFLCKVPHRVSKGLHAIIKVMRTKNALHEASALCSLRGHPHVIRLLGWFPRGFSWKSPDAEVDCVDFEPDGASDEASQVASYDADDTLTTLVIEYASRRDMYEYRRTRKGRRFGDGVIRRVIVQVTMALQACHGLGIVHGDIKPENVFIARDGTAKLGDFDTWQASGERDVDPSRLGTWDFISPETIVHGVRTEASDVWSLGEMIFEFYDSRPLLRQQPWYPQSALPRMQRVLIRRMYERMYQRMDSSLQLPSATKVPRSLKLWVTKMASVHPGSRPTLSTFLESDWMTVLTPGVSSRHDDTPAATTPTPPTPTSDQVDFSISKRVVGCTEQRHTEGSEEEEEEEVVPTGLGLGMGAV